MTKHEFSNALRLLLNIEGSQLPFLTGVQKDNFYANPHMFFIRADDATSDKLWDVMFPKPPVAREGVVMMGPGHWWRDDVRRSGVPAVDYEYDTGRIYPAFAPNTAADVPPLKFARN